MKITKKMYDKELKPYYWRFRILPFLATKAWGIKYLASSMNKLKGKNIEGLHCEERFIPSRNGGSDIRVRIFRPLDNQEKLSGMLYIHGGGYMVGNPEIAMEFIKKLIDARPCVIVAPDYTKSVKEPYPAAFNDCYDTLLWLKENAQSLHVRPNRFIVAGRSAGGGLTAAVTLKARDTKDVNIAFQIPIYPMIDDRQTNESARIMNSPAWDSKANAKGWELYLKDLKSNNTQIPPYAAPARNNDYSDFPPTITFVGELEPFRDETIAYVECLKKAGVPVKFELFERAFHAFEEIAGESEIGKRAKQFLLQSYGEFFDEAFA